MKKSKIVFIIFMIFAISLITINSFATEIELTENVISDAKYHNPDPITVPETDINITINNISKGCDVYLLLSTDMFKYNLERFIQNNKDNDYLVQAEEADKLQGFLDEEDYLSYIYYFKDIGFDISDNEMELRHYSFCLGTSEMLGYYEIGEEKYIQFQINLDDNNQFKLILKDYLNDYDSSDAKVLIDEYGIKTILNASDYGFVTNAEKSNISECNINYDFNSNEDYNAIAKAINISYLIIFIILIIIAIIIIVILIKRYKKKKQEIEDRKFWKKKLTKEEKKIEKKKLKNKKRLEKLEARKNKKKKK